MLVCLANIPKPCVQVRYAIRALRRLALAYPQRFEVFADIKDGEKVFRNINLIYILSDSVPDPKRKDPFIFKEVVKPKVSKKSMEHKIKKLAPKE